MKYLPSLCSAVLFLVGPVRGQERVEIQGPPVMDVVVDTIGPIIDSTDDLFPAAVMARRDDGLTLLRTYDPYRVVVFDRHGRTVADINSKGEGPGELRNVQEAGFLADTIWVLEPGGLLHLFDEGGRFLRRRQLPIAPKTLAAIPAMGFVINGFGGSLDWGGEVVHIQTGDSLFAVPRLPGEETSVSRIESWARTLAASHSGLVASGHLFTYRIDIIDNTRRVSKILERSGLIKPLRSSESGQQEQPEMLEMYFDANEDLWITYTQIDDGGLTRGDPGDRSHWSVFDWCVDVVDPDIGRLMASECHDRPLFFRLTEDGTSTIRPADGESLVVVSPRLVERSNPQ